MSKERRRFFRIDDIVGLKIEPVDKHNLEQTLENFHKEQHNFSIRNDFNYQLEQHRADLHHIKAKMPELGRYLSVLQAQIDSLTDRIISAEHKSSITRDTEANISAQGIAFMSDERLTSGEIIKLNLKLLPGQQKIVIYARVILCVKDPTDQGRYKIALDFEHIHEADREILVKHVHEKQIQSLGASRFEKND